MTKLGYKKITVKNWNEPDKLSTAYFTKIKKGKVIHWTGEDWVKALMKPRLSKKVPLEIRKLFEVTRGAMVYGYYFYPLYTLAGQQLFRIVDSACLLKCQELNSDKKFGNFKQRIEYLCDNNFIKEKEKKRWHAARDLRNIASHPDYQSILPPGTILESLNITASMINSLYK